MNQAYSRLSTTHGHKTVGSYIPVLHKQKIMNTVYTIKDIMQWIYAMVGVYHCQKSHIHVQCIP